MPTAEIQPTAEYDESQDADSAPVGVISTEAMETLAPVTPVSNEGTLPRARTKPRGVANAAVQSIATAAPLLVGDLLVVMGCFYGTTLLASAIVGRLPHAQFFWQGIAISGAFAVIGTVNGLYPATGISPVLELRQLSRTALTAFGLMLLSNALVAILSPFEIAVGLIGGFFAVLSLPIVRACVRHFAAKQSWWGERCLIIGAGDQGRAIYRFYQRSPQRGLRPMGLVDRWDTANAMQPILPADRYRYLGSVQRLHRAVVQHSIRWGIVAPGGCDSMDVSHVMQYCGDVPNVVVLPSQFSMPSLWASPRECAGVMGVHLKDHLRSPINAALKRSVDILGSSVGLLLASPLFLVATLWTKLQSRGPAFYGHTRIGRGGEEFSAWKFRTMVTNADEVLEQHLEEDSDMRQEWMEDQKLKNDPRVIPGIGKFLRKTSLDEIPQLWNVLRGEMSLVGPRPIVRSEIERYREMFPLYLRVSPGITGLWQVSGRNDTSYDQRVQLDSYYVCNWSPWLDSYILLRTVRTMVLREGAY